MGGLKKNKESFELQLSTKIGALLIVIKNCLTLESKNLSFVRSGFLRKLNNSFGLVSPTIDALHMKKFLLH